MLWSLIPSVIADFASACKYICFKKTVLPFVLSLKKLHQDGSAVRLVCVEKGHSEKVSDHIEPWCVP